MLFPSPNCIYYMPSKPSIVADNNNVTHFARITFSFTVPCLLTCCAGGFLDKPCSSTYSRSYFFHTLNAIFLILAFHIHFILFCFFGFKEKCVTLTLLSSTVSQCFRFLRFIPQKKTISPTAVWPGYHSCRQRSRNIERRSFTKM